MDEDVGAPAVGEDGDGLLLIIFNLNVLSTMTRAPQRAGRARAFQKRKFALVSFVAGGAPKEPGVDVIEEDAIGRREGKVGFWCMCLVSRAIPLSI